MKKASSIIHHLKSSPSLKYVQKTDCYKKLLALLPKNLQNSVRFMYNKNDTLFFVLEHPGYKMEFDYKMSLIKNLLNSLVLIDKECACIQAKNIKTFITNQPKIEEIKQESLPIYKERAKGEFINQAKREKLYTIFEEIRECIQNSSKH